MVYDSGLFGLIRDEQKFFEIFCFFAYEWL
jgi:hypothetical protein